MAEPQPRRQGKPTLTCLDGNALEAVFHAAKASDNRGALGRLSSTCRGFTQLARARIPSKLRVHPRFAQQLLSGRRPPFSALTSLQFEISTPADLNRAVALVVRFSSSWAQLEEVEIELGTTQVYKVSYESVQALREDCAATGLLGCLQALPQLTKLSLNSPTLGASSMYAIAQLTGLRHLWLSSPNYVGASADWAALRALRRLTNLGVALTLDPAAGPPPADSAEGFLLPPTLQVLCVSANDLVLPPTWLEHLEGCPNLKELSFSYGEQDQDVAVHPREVAAVAAQHCRQLTRLELSAPANRDLWWVDGPMSVGDAWFPCDGLAVPLSLQRLDCTEACQVELGRAADWRVLADMKQLTTLYGWRASVAPPAGLQLPAVCRLKGECVDASGRVLCSLLKACPQLQIMDVRVVVTPQWPFAQQGQQQGQGPPQQPQQEQPGQQQGQPPPQQQQGQVLLVGEAHPPAGTPALPGQEGAAERASTLTAAELCYQAGDAATASIVTRHFTTVAPSLAGLQELSLSWPLHGFDLLEVPDLSPLTRLKILRLYCEATWRALGEADDDYNAAQQVVSMLLPVRGTLEQVELANLHVGPRVALLLQDRLPVLELVNLSGNKDFTTIDAAQQHLKEVKAALRPGLQLLYGLPVCRAWRDEKGW